MKLKKLYSPDQQIEKLKEVCKMYQAATDDHHKDILIGEMQRILNPPYVVDGDLDDLKKTLPGGVTWVAP